MICWFLFLYWFDVLQTILVNIEVSSVEMLVLSKTYVLYYNVYINHLSCIVSLVKVIVSVKCKARVEVRI